VKFLHRIGSTATLAALAALLVGCPKTEYFNEGSGQPTDRASGKAPSGSVGACQVPNTKRPPIVNPALWDNLRVCNTRTPRRYLRLGYSRQQGGEIEVEERRMALVMKALADGTGEKDGNVQVLGMLRAVRQAAATDERLRARVERASGRTFACDYTYLLNTTRKVYDKLSVAEDSCSAYAFDPKTRTETCLFDVNLEASRWLTSSWTCLAFTETVGEGASCHRLCAYDDYCSAQVSCSRPDFDLAMCALGVCMPEQIQALF
jgi:hypothetical protein